MRKAARRPSSPESEELLEVVQLVTDAYLGHLGVDDILRELTQRVAGVMRADTAAVLLRDERSGDLVARAAHGIEEEVYQGVRVPVGRGFAGTIAASGQPLLLERIDKTTVVNPLLWERGIQALLGVPLTQGSQVIGVLHVGSLSARTFTREETHALQSVADRVASAVRDRGAEVERASAQVLQRSLLPANLPRCTGLEFATRYVAAETGGVGGDWYDVFRLPGGELWIMVGDVAGHGLAAAVTMGRLRSALRSYALEGHCAEDVLVLADRKLEFFEPGFMATALVAVSRPPYDRMTFTSAGHLPPVLAVPGAAPGLVDLPSRALLGVGVDERPRSRTIDLCPGATLLACTDGLIERPGESLDIGLQRLVAAMRADDPEELCRDLMDTLVGRALPRDDIAVLALRRAPGPASGGRARHAPDQRRDGRTVPA